MEDDLLGVEADRTQMQQVILNLCINSRDAMPEGGTIAVSTSNVELTKEDARRLHSAAAPGRYVMLSIADTGHGMDATTRERLFEPFFTTKGGSGLGLSMVYGIVQSHDGHTRVESEPGKGAVITVYLPALPTSIEETEAQQLPEVIVFNRAGIDRIAPALPSLGYFYSPAELVRAAKNVPLTVALDREDKGHRRCAIPRGRSNNYRQWG